MRELILSRLTEFQPRVMNVDFPQASVLVGITDEAEPQIILTKRSEQLRTHSGQVAFPGGMKDDSDKDLLAAALRETHEEIGVRPGSIEVIGQLSQVLSRHEIVVTPFVAFVDPDVPLIPEPGELDSVFTVPIEFFLSHPPHRIDRLGYKKYRLDVPCWFYGNYEIWGMSAIVLMELLQTVFDWNSADLLPIQ